MKLLFIFTDYSLHNHIISDYLLARPQDQAAVVRVSLVLKNKNHLQTATRILPRLSWRFALEKFVEASTMLLVTCLPKLVHRGAEFRRLWTVAARQNLPWHDTRNIMSPATLEFIRAQQPDLIVTLFHQIITEELIRIPPLGVVNIHPGLLPEFRGIQPYFWELSSGFDQAGVTFHLIEDSGIDTGAIVAQARYKTWPGMSVLLNYYLSCCAAAQVLPSLAERAEGKRLHPIQQAGLAGSYYQWPDDRAVRDLHRKGYRITSLRDLLDILLGAYEKFRPESVKFYE